MGNLVKRKYEVCSDWNYTSYQAMVCLSMLMGESYLDGFTKHVKHKLHLWAIVVGAT